MCFFFIGIRKNWSAAMNGRHATAAGRPIAAVVAVVVVVLFSATSAALEFPMWKDSAGPAALVKRCSRQQIRRRETLSSIVGVSVILLSLGRVRHHKSAYTRSPASSKSRGKFPLPPKKKESAERKKKVAVNVCSDCAEWGSRREWMESVWFD